MTTAQMKELEYKQAKRIAKQLTEEIDVKYPDEIVSFRADKDNVVSAAKNAAVEAQEDIPEGESMVKERKPRAPRGSKSKAAGRGKK